MTRTVRMLGTRGVPANYGGFETAAENVAKHLVARGWRVIVYCQVEGTGPLTVDTWSGIERVVIPVSGDGWLSTAKFDAKSILHAARHRDLCLTFGYNTAGFNLLQRIRRIPNVINMDGIEWSRARWGPVKRTILYINERVACIIGDHLIADHPEIAAYLHRKAPARKITTITYGADTVTDAPVEPLADYGLTPGRYVTLVARPILENSILEIVTGFSSKPRGHQLVVFGRYTPEENQYHRDVMAAASEEVLFIGGVYEPDRLQALRFHGLAYVHGHTVGGTNPSLVEALGAANPVIAHDNPYNRWVAGDAGVYFTTAQDVSDRLDELLETPDLARTLSSAARGRHTQEFTWDRVAGQYEELLARFTLPASTTGVHETERPKFNSR